MELDKLCDGFFARLKVAADMKKHYDHDIFLDEGPSY